jgi:hypothetical protein
MNTAGSLFGLKFLKMPPMISSWLYRGDNG